MLVHFPRHGISGLHHKLELEYLSKFNHETPLEDYVLLTLFGTTFSGEAITTLMNTFRNLMYAGFIIYKGLRVYFWLARDRLYILVAGDDSLILLRFKIDIKPIRQSALNNTSRQPTIDSPLG